MENKQYASVETVLAYPIRLNMELLKTLNSLDHANVWKARDAKQVLDEAIAKVIDTQNKLEDYCKRYKTVEVDLVEYMENLGNKIDTLSELNNNLLNISSCENELVKTVQEFNELIVTKANAIAQSEGMKRPEYKAKKRQLVGDQATAYKNIDRVSLALRYQNGESVEELAKAYQVSSNTIIKRLKELQVFEDKRFNNRKGDKQNG